MLTENSPTMSRQLKKHTPALAKPSGKVKGLKGARASAKARTALCKQGCALIKARWQRPAHEHRTKDLLQEAGQAVGRAHISYNTAIKLLGKRPRTKARPRSLAVRT